jgi:YHYH protein
MRLSNINCRCAAVCHDRPRMKIPFGKRPWLIMGVLLVCGGSTTATVAATTSNASAKRINPRAIPLGDGDVSTTPKVGYVDSCTTNFRGGGAAHSGPWIQGKTWDSITKPAVQGSVSWPNALYKVRTTKSKRIITFNDLPTDHTTGVFPISSSDPAYAYGRNPNHIAAHALSWKLALHPKKARRPSCTGLGPIGVLKDGVLLFNGLDAAGRDAAAHEVQDSCDGHPDGAQEYHDHDIPSCLLKKARNGRSTLVGYALDGYGIYVQKNKHGQLPTDKSLDACHGETSKVWWNGKVRRIYHYVATLEYPYTVGCFHGTPITVQRQPAPTPGASSGP